MLINSVLNCLLTHYMSLYLMPSAVRKKLERIQNKFLWDGMNDKRFLIPVKRSVVELLGEIGGLAIGNILHRNLALLFKWWWRFSTESNPLWKRIIKSVHKILDFKAQADIFKNCKNGLWGQFRMIVNKWGEVTKVVEDGLAHKLGDGRSLHFWEDI